MTKQKVNPCPDLNGGEAFKDFNKGVKEYIEKNTFPTEEDMTERLNKRILYINDYSIQTGYGMGFQECYEWIKSKMT